MKKEIPCICETCKKPFLGYNHRPNKFCSRKCCGVAKIGKPTWIKGRKAEWNKGEKNHQWKGDNASIEAIHNWVKREKGKPTKCEHCGFETQNHRKIHWANTNGHKYRKNVSDYIALCVSCHRKYDMTDEIRERMSKARLGKTPWNKGTKGVMKPNKTSFKKELVP